MGANDNPEAVNKPRGVTSADVVRKLQHHFNPSQLFKPWLDTEKARLQRERAASHSGRKQRRFQKHLDVKIGHGGTLDPLATGILVTGIGVGTKHLHDFLSCTKTYEAVVLFGAETDTYDRLGRVVRRAPYEHITREAVQKTIDQSFRGTIMQRPPIFSAVRFQGKRLYEYAREGRVPPVEIRARPVDVANMQILEWYPPGSQHEYKWPEQEMTGDEKAAAEQLLDKDDDAAAAYDKAALHSSSTKRKQPSASSTPEAATAGSGDAAPPDSKKQKNTITTDDSANSVQHEASPEQEAAAQPRSAEEDKPSESTDVTLSPLAVKVVMTVTSGFYVRSFAHDLGKALGSCGLMGSLVRTRQGDFSLGPDKVLEYSDLDAGEDVWGYKVRRFLEDWRSKNMAEQKD